MSSRKPMPVKQVQPVPMVHKSGLHMTAHVRDLTQVPMPTTPPPAESQALVAYKDLNENAHLQMRRQKQQMLFAFSFFLLLGVLIVAGQTIQKNRMIASHQDVFKVDGPLTPVDRTSEKK